MLFHLVLLENGQVLKSPFPKMEAWYYQDKVEYLSMGIPLGILEDLLREINFSNLANESEKEKFKAEVVAKFTASLESKIPISWDKLDFLALSFPFEAVRLDLNTLRYNFLERINGRIISEEEFMHLSEDLKVDKDILLRFAHFMVEQGIGRWFPAIEKNRKKWICKRCGKTDMEEWPSIFGLAATCSHCAYLGALNSNKILFSLNPNTQMITKSERTKNFLLEFKPHWELTEGQKSASKELLHFFQKSLAKKILLWAVCGAGKTEVCFPLIFWALREGKKILFAAPRQDVVHDVIPKLERDFPGIGITVLSGISSEKFNKGEIVVATTHQVLKFKKFFDLAILDETDAYPYYGSELLEEGLGQALKEDGKIAYLTATPSKNILKEIDSKACGLIRLPARHHRKPVPVPVHIKCKCQADGVNSQITELVSALIKEGPVLVFVPRISWVNSIVNCFRKEFPHNEIDGSFASDPKRWEKVEKLKEGYYNLFVSTSILERSITISKVQVIIMSADNSIYDDRTLVQMAGRVGRTTGYPYGKVFFLAERYTSQMVSAINIIKNQNGIALERGLLDEVYRK